MQMLRMPHPAACAFARIGAILPSPYVHKEAFYCCLWLLALLPLAWPTNDAVCVCTIAHMHPAGACPLNHLHSGLCALPLSCMCVLTRAHLAKHMLDGLG